MKNDRWLIVFDNADRLDQLYPYLPDGSGHVIITSRDKVWRQVARVLEVDAWQPAESLEFITQRLGQEHDHDVSAAAMITQMLGHLPLALEQATAFMEATRTRYRQYVRMLSESSDHLLDEGAPVALDYSKTVATTWNVTLDRIRDTRPDAVRLLELCAFLALDAIPDAMLKSAHKQLVQMPDAGDRLAFEEALGILSRYSMIRRRDGSVSLHRLVQHVVRTALTEQERAHCIDMCLCVVAPAFATDTSLEKIISPASALPHVLALAPHAVPVRPDVAQELLLRAGTFMAQQAQLEGAQASLEQAHTIATQIHGESNPEVAEILTALGRVLLRMADLAAARACFERALSIAEPAYGSDHGMVLALLNELGHTLMIQGDLPGAKVYLDRALMLSNATNEDRVET